MSKNDQVVVDDPLQKMNKALIEKNPTLHDVTVSLILDLGQIPNVGCAKFFQDINQFKFKSFKTISLIRTVLKIKCYGHISNKEYISIAASSYENLVQNVIHEMLDNSALDDSLASLDIDHVIENLPIYLNQQPQDNNAQVREFCQQVYNKFNSNPPKEIKESINIFNVQISTDEYNKKLLELKKIFYGQNIIAADKIFIRGLELMIPFFVNSAEFDVKKINNFIYSDTKNDMNITSLKGKKVIDSSKHLGDSLTYKINDDKTAVIFYFKGVKLIIDNKSEFFEITNRFLNETQIKNANLYDMIKNVATVVQWRDENIKFTAKQIKPSLYNEQVTEEQKSLKDSTKSRAKLIDLVSISGLNTIDQEFFNKEKNQDTIAKINQLNIEQKAHLINFHQKYFNLRAEKKEQLAEATEIYGWQENELKQIPKSYENVNLREIQIEDLKHIVNIFVENNLLEPKYINEFIINFVNSPIKTNDNYISVPKNKGKEKLEKNSVDETENKSNAVNKSTEKTKQSLQELEDFELAKAFEASKQEYEREQKKLYKLDEGGSSSSGITCESEENESTNNIIDNRLPVARKLFKEEQGELKLLGQNESTNYEDDPLLKQLNNQVSKEEEQLQLAIELSLKSNLQQTIVDQWSPSDASIEIKRDQQSTICNNEKHPQSLIGGLDHID